MHFKLDKSMAEIVGRIISDGNLWSKNGHYEVSIAGSRDDLDYFEQVKATLSSYGVHSRIRYRQGALRLIVRSKRFYIFLTEDLKMAAGNGKAASTKIPVELLGPTLLNHVVRGIFDGDGTIFFSKKPGVLQYPTIEITTTSRSLALQLVSLLQTMTFRVTLRSFMENRLTYKIAINGRAMVAFWFHRIGSSHPKKRNRLRAVALGSI